MDRRFAIRVNLLILIAAIVLFAAWRLGDGNPPVAAIKSAAASASLPPVDARASRSCRRESGEWQSLFNGCDLTGWRHVGGGHSFVQNGVLMLADDADRKPGYLVSTMTARNLRAKLRCQVPTGDSGFYFRGRFDPHTPTEVLGLQVQLNMQPDCGLGGLFEPQGRGWLVKPRQKPGFFEKPGFSAAWLDCEVDVQNRHIRVTIDGVATVDFTDPDPDNRYGEAGFFALQIHGGGFCDARFQTILVQPLD